MRQGQVLRLERIRFDQEVFIWDVDITGYIAKALTCTFKGIFAYLIAIGEALSIPPATPSEVFIEPIADQFDQILFVVRPDAAIAVQLYGLKYDIACEEAEPVPQPPPPPPEFPNYPPGTELKDTDTPASEPYDPPNDAGNTIPLPGDEAPPEPPPIPDCTPVNINIVCNQNLGGGAIIPRNYNYPGKAPVIDVFVGNIVSGGSDIFVVDRFGPSNTCLDVPTQRSVNRGLGIFEDLVVTITEV
jgi:hypothetical protein